MKAPAHRSTEPARQRAEALVETQVQALFQRLPMLSGFAVAANLDVTDVTIHSWPGYIAGEALYSEIANCLVDLLEDRPDSTDFLRGRTFARSLQ